MIFTSYYSNKEGIDNDKNCYVSISVGTPRWHLPYELKHCYILKPFSIFNKFDNMVDYEREYRKYLDSKGVDEIFNSLERIRIESGKENLVLLCYEKDKKECHRYVFAKWWQEKTGEVIREIAEKDEQMCLF